MKTFQFTANAAFVAEDAGDAARKIAAHFTNIANIWEDSDDEDDSMQLHFIGELSIEPALDKPEKS